MWQKQALCMVAVRSHQAWFSGEKSSVCPEQGPWELGCGGQLGCGRARGGGRTKIYRWTVAVGRQFKVFTSRSRMSEKGTLNFNFDLL